jgi:hypothetical protein
MRFVICPGGLEPFDQEARDFLDRQQDGEPIDVEILHERDMIEHRRIFGIIGDVAKALHRTTDSVRAELLVATGNFQLIDSVLGTPIVAVSSMSRPAMRDHELHAFWSEAKEVIAHKLLAQIADPAELARLAEALSPPLL